MVELSRTMIIEKHARKITKLSDLFEAVHDFPIRTMSLAVANDTAALSALREAHQKNLVDYVLVGDKREIMRVASELDWEALDEDKIVDEPSPIRAAGIAVEMASSGEVQMVMKGKVHTDDFLRAVLDREEGLRTRAVMSHVFIWDADVFGRLVFVTDAAMNIAPDLVTKAAIIMNAVHLAGIFGVVRPKVAVLAAVEVVNPKMQATADAAALAAMATRRQFSVSCTIEGPFALDNALNELAAQVKGIEGIVAGRADILLAPNIEAGNMLAKAYKFVAGCEIAGVLVGAKVPVVLTSRADSAQSKLYSIAAGVLMSGFERDLRLKIGKVHF